VRYGYWLPVFGGWLRNVEDEGMQASWEYVSRLARRSEKIGYDLTLVAELPFVMHGDPPDRIRSRSLTCPNEEKRKGLGLCPSEW
jgi:hypothetical protein